MPKSHTELICWQLADELRQLIIEHTADGSAAGRDYRFTSNLRDAIASACRNQSEGFYKYKHKPQRPFFVTARASLGETKDGIEDGRERGYFGAELAQLEKLCGRAMIANLRWLKSVDRPDPEDEA
jgi:four helix bundle protein